MTYKIKRFFKKYETIDTVMILIIIAEVIVMILLLLLVVYKSLVLKDFPYSSTESVEATKEIDSAYTVLEVDGEWYSFVNRSDIYNISSESIELHTTTIGENKYCYVKYGDTLIMCIDNQWYQYVLSS